MEFRQMMGLGVLLALPPSVLGAESAIGNQEGPPMLISADQLETRLGEKTLRILDVRSQDEFEKGHIPGAVRVEVAEWKSLAKTPNGLHNAAGWARIIGELGLATKDSEVVVYGDKHSNTARVWWVLKYVGVSNVSILDGGWQYWAKTARSTQTTTTEVSATVFRPDFQKDRLEEIGSLKQSLKSVQVIDTRSSEEFAAGHIPTSTRLEWKELVADDGRFKTKTELQQIFKKHNILPAEAAVCY